MLRVVSCLTTQHDWRLVLLAVAVCFLTSVAAIALFRRAVATTERARLIWLLTAGLATGYGIWATHFIAILAYSPGFPIGYDLSLTLLSLFAAAAITGFSLAFAVINPNFHATGVGGAGVGVGIAVMHYTGMAAFAVPGTFVWQADLVVASIVLGIVFGIAAVYAALHLRGRRSALLAALLLALAIVTMHFTAMGAVEVILNPIIDVSAHSLSPTSLAMAIAGAAGAVLGISLVAAEAARSRQQLIERSDAEIARQSVRLAAALANMSQGLCMFDAQGRVVLANRHYATMYGLDPEQVRPGTTLRQILEARIEQDVYGPIEASAFIEAALADFDRELDEILHLANGRFIAVSRRPMADGSLVTTHEDVTERQRLQTRIEQQNRVLKKQEELLRMQNLQLDAALNNISQGLCMFDARQRVVVCNARYLEIYGLSSDQVIPGTTLSEIVNMRIERGLYAGASPQDYISERLAPVTRPSEVLHEMSDGRVIGISRRLLPGGGWVATHEDVTERRRVEARIAHLAHHDVLTDLPNRALLRERLEQAATAMHQGGRPFAVLVLDLDRFKEVNDTLGHPIGDLLLKSVTQRLKSCVSDGDTIARLGGDEFAIVHRSMDVGSKSIDLARRIQDALEAPFDLDGHHAVIGTSIGIAIAPTDGDSPDQLLRNADLALYRAKNDGANTYRLFEPEMDRLLQERRGLERDLRNALIKGELALYYQPLVNLDRDEICGFEALLRWSHPRRGNTPPSTFIPVAEETGLIVPIGEWVLRQACAEAANWPGHLKIAVNVSPAQFKSRNFGEVILQTLATTGLAPHRLELEITESAVLEGEEAAFAILSRLRDIGVRIALDDFGTGYSSLSNLRKFRFDKIKIDRSFVSELSGANLDALAVVRSVAQLGVSLGMATTAEGVETKDQMEHVRAEGCTEMQGYYVCRPSPPEEIRRLIRDKCMKSASAA